ncbi:MAG: hypothetical protein OHK0038_23760 [Flammeovirgaceae bacterium]
MYRIYLYFCTTFVIKYRFDSILTHSLSIKLLLFLTDLPLNRSFYITFFRLLCSFGTCLSLVCILTLNVFAQETQTDINNDSPFSWEAAVGSNFSTGNEQINPNISPTLLYKPLPYLQLGLGVTSHFEQNSLDIISTQPNTKNPSLEWDASFGLRTFVRLSAKSYLPYLQLEYEGRSQKFQQKANPSVPENEQIQWQSFGNIGAGYKVQLTEKEGVQVALLKTLLSETSSQKDWQFRLAYTHRIADNKINSSQANQYARENLENTPKKALSTIDLSKYKFLENILERVQIEPTLGASFGKFHQLDISPSFNVKLSKYWTAGIAPVFRRKYQDEKESGSSQLGGRLMFRVHSKYEWLPFLQAEASSLTARDTLSENNKSIRYQSLWLGTGYTLKMTEKLSFNVSVLRDITWKGENLSQTSPWQFRCSFPIDSKQQLIANRQKLTANSQQLTANRQRLMNVEGNFSLSFGKDAAIDFSPVLAWKLAPSWTLGGGPSYQYQKISSTQSSATQYGARIFGRYTAKEKLPYLQTETQWLNSPSKEKNAEGRYERTWKAHLLAGTGYNFPVFQQTSLNIALLYDFTWHKQPNTFYKSPSPWVVRIGVGF